MNNILVSVVIPTYKRTDNLKRAVESIVSQTHKNLDIIIIDDNIDDDISDKVSSIISDFHDERIKYYRNEKNMGGACSRNRGISLSKGEYIAFLDDDDCYTEKNIELKLEKFLNTKNPKLALVYGWTQSRNENDELIANYNNTAKGNCIYEAMMGCPAATSQWMCKKEALLNVGMFNDVPSKQDSTLILKLLLAGYEMDYVPKTLSYYYEHNNNRISMGKIHNMHGEMLLRDYMRNNYHILSKEQQNNVEITISKRILQLAIKNKKNDIAKKEFKGLWKYKNCRKQVLKIFIKGKIKAIINK